MSSFFVEFELIERFAFILLKSSNVFENISTTSFEFEFDKSTLHWHPFLSNFDLHNSNNLFNHHM